MELSPAEEAIIEAFREVDRQNPAGIDGFTTAFYLEKIRDTILYCASDAGRRYRLFLEQSKNGQLVDLREAQRPKHAWDDPRGEKPGAAASGIRSKAKAEKKERRSI